MFETHHQAAKEDCWPNSLIVCYLAKLNFIVLIVKNGEHMQAFSVEALHEFVVKAKANSYVSRAPKCLPSRLGLATL